MKKHKRMPFASERLFTQLMLVAVLGIGTIGGCRRAPPPPPAEAKAPPPVAQQEEPSYPVSPVLDYAWKFALSITDDAKDRGRTQERVALAYLEKGNPAKALEFAAQFGDWRGPLIVAETAAWMARHGRKEEARKLIEDARRVGTLPTDAVDWRAQELFMRVAAAQACLGESSEIDVLADMVQRDAASLGRARVYKALCLANQGKSREALQLVDTVAAAHAEFDELLWRVDGFRLLAESGKLEPAETRLALDKAEQAARRFHESQRALSLMDVADTASRVLPGERESLLEDATRAALDPKWPPEFKGTLLARAMTLWARNKRKDKFDELAAVVENPAFGRPHLTTDLTDLFCGLAEAYAANGDQPKSLAAFRQALHVTAVQANIRPRGMQGVTICLAMDRCGFGFRELRTELDGLLEGAHAQSP